jgi:hypothetical protein
MQKIVKPSIRRKISFLFFVILFVTKHSLNAQSYETLPINEKFSGGLPSTWSTDPNGNGVVEIRDESGSWPQFGTTAGPDGSLTGGNGLAFYNSATSASEDISSALLHLNLSF